VTGAGDRRADTWPLGVAAKPASARPVMVSPPVPRAVAVPDRVDTVWGWAVQLVDTTADAHLLTRLLHDEHPQGAVQQGGRPLRSLITSDHGVLGGVVLARPARALKPRDQWMGWDLAQRRRHLSQVVGLSRCLIRPLVRCPHRASQALGAGLRR